MLFVKYQYKKEDVKKIILLMVYLNSGEIGDYLSSLLSISDTALEYEGSALTNFSILSQEDITVE